MTTQTSLLRLILPVQGEFSGTWGDQVNAGLTSLVDSAIAGTTTLSADADTTLTTANFAADQARAMVLLCSGTRTAIRNINAPNSSKVYVVVNTTSFGQTLRGVTGPTTGVTIPPNSSALCAWNGTDFVVVAQNNLSTNLTGTLAVAQGGTGVTTSTGSGNTVLSASPTLTAPVMDSINGGQLAGLRNRIINGDMRVNQRVSGSSGNYSLDRFFVQHVSGPITWQQGTGGFGSYASATCLQLNGAVGNTGTNVYQRIESANSKDLAGQNVTVSYWVYQNTGSSMNVNTTLQYANSVDNFSGVTTIASSGTTTVPSGGSATKIIATFTVPAAATTGLQLLLISNTPVLVAGQNIQIFNVQLELGSVATTFEQRPYGIELALCQRYYATDTYSIRGFFSGGGQTITVPVKYPVTMRISPTLNGSGGTFLNVSGTVLNGSGVSSGRADIVSTVAGDGYGLDRVYTAAAEL